jgi:hypothetical protein
MWSKDDGGEWLRIWLLFALAALALYWERIFESFDEDIEEHRRESLKLKEYCERSALVEKGLKELNALGWEVVGDYLNRDKEKMKEDHKKFMELREGSRRRSSGSRRTTPSALEEGKQFSHRPNRDREVRR